MKFFAELRRRNVYRVITAYIIVGWLIMQVVDVMAPALLLPEWIASLVAVLLLIGFPIALVLSWVYDVTPDGVIRTDAQDAASSQATSRRLDILIMAGLVTVASLIVWQQLDGRDDSDNRLVAENSIAVLPFEDLSREGNQQYFADGIAEEILNELASAGPLMVTGRTSSFSFRNSDRTLTEIGEKLGVSAVLEGSVRMQDKRVRIDARLVRARDGIMLWTDTFDTRVDDIFGVQDEIARRTLEQLTSRIDGTAADLKAPQRGEFAAYDNFLRARDLVITRDLQALQEARRLLDVSITLDPDFAPPLALLAVTERLLTNAPGGQGRTPIAVSLPKAINLADRALVLDPSLADAHAIRGLLHMDQKQPALGEASLRRALDLNPNHINARLWLALVLAAKQDHLGAAEQLARLFEVDPLFTPVAGNLVGAWLAVDRPDKALAVIKRLERLQAPDASAAWPRFVFNRRRGNVAAAINAVQPIYDQQVASTLAAGLAMARLQLGDTAGAQRYGMPFAPIRAALISGEYDAAVAEAAALLERSKDYFVFQIEYIITLAAAREDERLISYYFAEFGDPELFGASLVWPFNLNPELPPFAALASAMHRSGEYETELAAVLERWRQVIDVGRAHGGSDPEYERNDAYWHALTGDYDTAMIHLKAAAATGNGLLGVPLYDRYLHELLSAHPDHPQLMLENLNRVNEERAAIGLSAVQLPTAL